MILSYDRKMCVSGGDGCGGADAPFNITLGGSTCSPLLRSYACGWRPGVGADLFLNHIVFLITKNVFDKYVLSKKETPLPDFSL